MNGILLCKRKLLLQEPMTPPRPRSCGTIESFQNWHHSQTLHGVKALLHQHLTGLDSLAIQCFHLGFGGFKPGYFHIYTTCLHDVVFVLRCFYQSTQPYKLIQLILRTNPNFAKQAKWHPTILVSKSNLDSWYCQPPQTSLSNWGRRLVLFLRKCTSPLILLGWDSSIDIWKSSKVSQSSWLKSCIMWEVFIL